MLYFKIIAVFYRQTKESNQWQEQGQIFKKLTARKKARNLFQEAGFNSLNFHQKAQEKFKQ
jgi:hypothetical protein